MVRPMGTKSTFRLTPTWFDLWHSPGDKIIFYAECIEYMYCTMLFIWASVQDKTKDKKRNDTNLIVNLN